MFYKFLIVLMPVVALAACSEVSSTTMTTNPNASQTTTPMLSNNLQGVWEGSAYQKNDDSYWTIKATITPNHSKIDYPSLKCGGELTLLKRTATQMQFRETLTYGKSTCVDDGKIVITQNATNTATFEWFDDEGSRGAYGNLKRR